MVVLNRRKTGRTIGSNATISARTVKEDKMLQVMHRKARPLPGGLERFIRRKVSLFKRSSLVPDDFQKVGRPHIGRTIYIVVLSRGQEIYGDFQIPKEQIRTVPCTLHRRDQSRLRPLPPLLTASARTRAIACAQR